MTQTAKRKLAVLRNSTKRYSPRLQTQLSRAGKRPDSAVVESAAKYYVALRKLAHK